MASQLTQQSRFLKTLGNFHVAFAGLNLQVDWAIGRFLKLTPEQAHTLTAGLMFGPKARILADLVSRSDHPKKAKILEAFNKLRGNNKRDVIAHGYIWSDVKTVKFVERIASGKLRVKSHAFTFEQFEKHVYEMVKLGEQFHEALGIRPGDISEFADTALSLE